jgi:small-conductance mechanosensitive channel
VVSNFISGIIILMDRSIKPGDTITVGETFGWIRELRARFVSVVTRDGREYLIPNEDFITERRSGAARYQVRRVLRQRSAQSQRSRD